MQRYTIINKSTCQFSYRDCLKYINLIPTILHSFTEHCELLRVDKDDFNTLLARSEDTEWSNRLKALQSLHALADWTEEELLTLNRHCRNVDYPKNKVCVHFVA